jgi:hypothetical protein
MRGNRGDEPPLRASCGMQKSTTEASRTKARSRAGNQRQGQLRALGRGRRACGGCPSSELCSRQVVPLYESIGCSSDRSRRVRNKRPSVRKLPTAEDDCRAFSERLKAVVAAHQDESFMRRRRPNAPFWRNVRSSPMCCNYWAFCGTCGKTARPRGEAAAPSCERCAGPHRRRRGPLTRSGRYPRAGPCAAPQSRKAPLREGFRPRERGP